MAFSVAHTVATFVMETWTKSRSSKFCDPNKYLIP